MHRAIGRSHPQSGLILTLVGRLHRVESGPSATALELMEGHHDEHEVAADSRPPFLGTPAMRG